MMILKMTVGKHSGKRISWFKKLFLPQYNKDDRTIKKVHPFYYWFYRRRHRKKQEFAILDRINMIYIKKPKKKYFTYTMRRFKIARQKLRSKIEFGNALAN